MSLSSISDGATLPNQCSDHTVELCTLLLSLDANAITILRELGQPNEGRVARLVKLVLSRLHGGQQEQGIDEAAVNNVQFTLEDLKMIMPKCNEAQIAEVNGWLRNGIGEEDGPNQAADGTAPGNDPNPNNPDPPPLLELDILPLAALEILLNRNTNEQGAEFEHVIAVRRTMFDSAFLHILLDALAHFSHQSHRHGGKNQKSQILGYFDFNESSAKQEEKLTAKRTPAPAPKRGTAARGRRGARSRARGSAGRKRNWGGSRVPAESFVQSDSTRVVARQWDEKMVEWLLKILTAFLNPYKEIPMDQDILTILRRSCLRNTVRNYLMNGNLAELVELIPLMGSLIQLLQTIANSMLTFIDNLSLLYSNNEHAAENSTKTSNNAEHGGCVYAFDVIFDQNDEDNEGGDDPNKAGPSSSTAPTSSGQPLLALLNTFANQIDSHFQRALKMSEQNAEADNDELMSLASLGTLCKSITQMVEEQRSVILSIQLTEKEHSKTGNNPETANAKEPSTSNGTSTAAGNNDAELEKRYVDLLKPLQFETIPFGDGNAVVVPHHFRSMFGGAGTSMGASNPRSKRIFREIFTLESGLPMSLQSAAFVRVAEERMDAMKILITGPEGTPYENGCFEFDFFLQPNFPIKPPNVNFRTTGNGTVYFNPNLYACGKVCLSLLGTWSGPNVWNAETSTLLQVINSIQALILVQDPWFNEPGRDGLRNKPVGKNESAKYNNQIRPATVHWAMIEMLRHPPAGFEEVIHRHFWVKQAQIEAQLTRWTTDGTKLGNLPNQLKSELRKLKPPEA